MWIFQSTLVRYNLHTMKCIGIKYIVWWVLANMKSLKSSIAIKIKKNISTTQKVSLFPLRSVFLHHCHPCCPKGLVTLFLLPYIRFMHSKTSYKWKLYSVRSFTSAFLPTQCLWDSPRLIQVSAVHYFLGWAVIPCMHIPQFVYAFICWWAFV